MSDTKNSFGSVRKLPSGKWQASYDVPISLHHLLDESDPRRIYAPNTFPYKKGALDWLADQQTLLAGGKWQPPSALKMQQLEKLERQRRQLKTFGEYAQEWLAASTDKPGTIEKKQTNLRCHILPYWEDVPINSITRARVKEWIAGGLSKVKPGAREKVFENFKAIMNSAEIDEVIDRAPTFRGLQVRKHGEKSARHKARALSILELRLMLESLTIPKYRIAFQLMAFCGLRIGELRELRAIDYDPQTKTIHITRAVSGEGKRTRIDTPKTARSVRAIPLGDSPFTVEFEKYLATLPTKRSLIVPNRQGETISIQAITKQWNEHREKINAQHAPQGGGEVETIPYFTSHDLRHSYITTAQGMPGATTRDVMDIVGHTRVEHLIGYSHSDISKQRAISSHVANMVLENDTVTPLRPTGTQ